MNFIIYLCFEVYFFCVLLFFKFFVHIPFPKKTHIYQILVKKFLAVVLVLVLVLVVLVVLVVMGVGGGVLI